MRIKISGDTKSAASVRGMLNADPSVVISDTGFLFEIHLFDSPSDVPTIDGVDSEWERRLINRISAVSDSNILLLRSGGVRSDQYISIGVPVSEKTHLFERGIFQAILQMVNTPVANRTTEAQDLAEAREKAALASVETAEKKRSTLAVEVAEYGAKLDRLKAEIAQETVRLTTLRDSAKIEPPQAIIKPTFWEKVKAWFA